MKRKVAILISLIICLVIMSPTAFAYKEERKCIKIGGDVDYPPYEFLDSNGDYRGFNVGIMKAVADEMGYDVEIVSLTWDQALKELKEGRIDAVQGASKTKDREKEFLFSDPYAINEQVIFTLKETTYISDLDDLKGKTVSIQKDDISEEILKNTKGINVISVPTQKKAIDLLLKKEVDAFVGNKLVGLFHVQKDELNKVKVTGETLQNVDYSLITTKENKELIKNFNAALKKVKEKGIHKDLKKKWFGSSMVYSEDTWRQVTAGIIFVGSIVSGIVGFILFINRRLKNKIAERTNELEEVNKAITANEEMYRRFIESCPDAIFAHREDNIILFVNDEGRRLLGASSKKEIIGRNIEEFLGDMSYLDGLKVYDSRGRTVHEKVIKRFDGSNAYVEVRVSHMNYEGERSMLSIVTNVSERKRLVEAIEYDKVKTEFFANISHELRTPLNVILASLQLMETRISGCNKDCALKDDINTSIEGIRHNGHRLLRLVNNLIDITKIDSGYLSVNLKNGNIIDAIESTVTAVIEYAHLKDIEVIFDTDTEELIMAYDEDKIERIMLNLLSNAVKFSKDGGEILVDIKTYKDKIEIYVIDNGVGIPKDKLLVVFERFRQVNKSLTRSSEGSGIGLSLVRSLVEMLDGDVTVKSKYGKGTTFIVTLPIKIIDADEEVENRSLITNREMADIEFSDIT